VTHSLDLALLRSVTDAHPGRWADFLLLSSMVVSPFLSQPSIIIPDYTIVPAMKSAKNRLSG